jgi:tRNA nucleotidyltransferase (CCA-adding enzyme)
MNVKKQYDKLLRKLETTSPIRFYDSIQLNEFAMNSRLKNKWNTCISYDLFVPNTKKPYSILNTDDSSKGGTHWVAVYQSKNKLYVYDSFARSKKLMTKFVKMMKSKGFEVVFVNQGKDQQEREVNCGLRCFLWLVMVDRYNITVAKKI